MKQSAGPTSDDCVPTYIATCEKGTYPISKIESKKEIDPLDRPNDNDSLLESRFTAREINLENILSQHHEKLENITSFGKLLVRENLKPSDYLQHIESTIPEGLISTKCFGEIKRLAANFSGNLTSFFGFESHLNKSEATSDYLFAISARKGEREALIHLIKNDEFSMFCTQTKWQQIAKFSDKWTGPDSILHENVLGLWFEFDSNDFASIAPIPNVFLQIKPIRIDTPDDIRKCIWLTQEAYPLLTGQKISKKIEQSVLRCIQQLPSGSSCIHFGVMLSRPTEGVRLVLNRIPFDQIVPYLHSIGWLEDSNELSLLLNELENHVTRIVLHINVGEQIDPKIGLECSFYPDRYHLEDGWKKFFEFLDKKGLCIPEKKSVVLSYPGVELGNKNEEFDICSYMISTKVPTHSNSQALVRYISHVKIIYQPNHPLEAKAYPGVRLFGHS